MHRASLFTILVLILAGCGTTTTTTTAPTPRLANSIAFGGEELTVMDTKDDLIATSALTGQKISLARSASGASIAPYPDAALVEGFSITTASGGEIVGNLTCVDPSASAVIIRSPTAIGYVQINGELDRYYSEREALILGADPLDATAATTAALSVVVDN